MTTIAFIGLGNMGAPMAANLTKAGHTVIGFDLSETSRREAEAMGITIAATAADALRDASAVVTMLPAGSHVRTVWSQIATAARPGTLLIDSSTIDVDSARAVRSAAEQVDVHRRSRLRGPPSNQQHRALEHEVVSVR